MTRPRVGTPGDGGLQALVTYHVKMARNPLATAERRIASCLWLVERGLSHEVCA